MTNVLRIALVIGALVDGGVAVLCFFFQPYLGPLLDFPVKDPALTTVAGGEFLVVMLVYVVILRGIEKARPLLWIVALDQFFACALPALEMMRGNAIVSVKTVGPMPLNIALAVIFTAAAMRKTSLRSSGS